MVFLSSAMSLSPHSRGCTFPSPYNLDPRLPAFSSSHGALRWSFQAVFVPGPDSLVEYVQIFLGRWEVIPRSVLSHSHYKELQSCTRSWTRASCQSEEQTMNRLPAPGTKLHMASGSCPAQCDFALHASIRVSDLWDLSHARRTFVKCNHLHNPTALQLP